MVRHQGAKRGANGIRYSQCIAAAFLTGPLGRPQDLQVLLYDLGCSCQGAARASGCGHGSPGSSGRARDAGIDELIAGIAPLHPRHDTIPGEVFLRLAADVLGWCGPARRIRCPLAGIRERFLTECTVRGQETVSMAKNSCPPAGRYLAVCG